jgi:phenylacetate-CoA ligase
MIMREIFDQYLAALARTEKMSLRDLAAYQQELLIRLVRHAHGSLGFYRGRLDCLVAADGKIDLSRWSSVPILRRDEVVAHGSEMRLAALPPEYGVIGEFRTSGSTGTPLSIACNSLVFVATNAFFTRMARALGLDTSRPLAAIRLFSHGSEAPYPGRVSQGWSFADPDAPFFELELMTPVEQQLEWLRRHQAPYLVIQPSGALAIAHAVTPEQGRALGLEMVFLVGETIPDGTREFIAERLGARMAGFYSCREIGPVAWECAAAPHYHVAAENALVEILDEQGRDVAPGGRGRVVVTGFYNYAMPLIRYEVGDIAEAGSMPCPCGRAAPVIAHVDGRTRNAFVFRDGTRLWPRTAMVRAMLPFVPFRRCQLVQLDHEQIEFRYLPDGSGREPDLAGLAASARQTFHPSVRISLVAVEALEAGPGGKVDEFLSRLDEWAQPLP